MITSHLRFSILVPITIVAGIACSSTNSPSAEVTMRDAGGAEAAGPAAPASWQAQDVVSRANADHPLWVRPGVTTQAHLLETKAPWLFASACPMVGRDHMDPCAYYVVTPTGSVRTPGEEPASIADLLQDVGGEWLRSST